MYLRVKDAELRGLIMWYMSVEGVVYYIQYMLLMRYDFYFTFICINYEGTIWKEFLCLVICTYNTYTYTIYLHGIPKSSKISSKYRIMELKRISTGRCVCDLEQGYKSHFGNIKCILISYTYLRLKNFSFSEIFLFILIVGSILTIWLFAHTRLTSRREQWICRCSF